MAALSREKLDQMGFLSLGEDVMISELASFHGVARIKIGNNVRIDDFCVLSAGSGGITIGDHVHVAVYSSLIGTGSISVGDFCNISSRVAIYSSSDDYSGTYMTNPTVPAQYTGVTHADVILHQHVIVGCGSVILPGVTLHDGVAIGACSLVNRHCEAYGIYVGVPARRIKERKRDLLGLARDFLLTKSGPA